MKDPLTKRQRQVLEQMDRHDHDHGRPLEPDCYDDCTDGEIICEGLQCWIGLTSISVSTVKAFLRLCVIRNTNIHGEAANIRTYEINESGRAGLKGNWAHLDLLKRASRGLGVRGYETRSR